MDERMGSQDRMDGELEQALQQGLARQSAPDGLEERILAAAMAARQAGTRQAGGRTSRAGLAGWAGMRLLRGGRGVPRSGRGWRRCALPAGRWTRCRRSSMTGSDR